jgi:hypothetical protein
VDRPTTIAVSILGSTASTVAVDGLDRDGLPSDAALSRHRALWNGSAMADGAWLAALGHAEIVKQYETLN